MRWMSSARRRVLTGAGQGGARLAALLLASLFGVVALTAAAEVPRHALVIGNADYVTQPLANPVNDARAIAARLEQLGFEVRRLENATLREMSIAVSEFGQRLTRDPGAAALFFYAGHGIQARGKNYLLPVDASMDSAARARGASVELDDVLEELEHRGRGVNIVILDACRNDPFSARTRGASRGLARVNVASGTLVAYATEPGSVADDGDGANSVYTEALLAALAEPALDEDDVFKRVGARVEQRTGGQQRPWREGSLRGDFVFNPGATPAVTGAVASAAPAPSSDTAVELAYWQSIDSSQDPAMYRAYLQRYPQGAFAELARLRLERLDASQATVRPAAQASLVVRSNVSRDTVYINGEAHGPTGPRAITLAPGVFDVRVERDGYESAEQRVELAAGDSRTLRFQLQRSTALAAAGTAAAVPVDSAASTAAEPPARAQAAADTGAAASTGSRVGAALALARELLGGGERKPDAASVARTAREAMTRFAADARRIASDPAVSAALRSERFRDLLGYLIDFEAMGKLVLGKHRASMTIDQWDTFIGLYRRLLVGGDYAFSSVDRWSGKVDLQDVRQRGEDYIARLVVTQAGQRPLRLDFRVRRSDAAGLPYKVIDVAAGGVSLVTTQRGEFGAILQRDGADGLNRLLADKVARRAAG